MNLLTRDEVLRDVYLVLPLIILSLGSLAVLLIDVFRRKPWPSVYASILILLGALVSAVAVAPEYHAKESAFYGTLFVDPFTSFVTVLILAGAILCMMIGKDFLQSEGIAEEGEYSSLYLMATAGAVLFVSAIDFITLFVGLEVMSMALYALCGSALRRRSSSESALKYFFLGSFSSAFLLFGMALLYGVTGSFSLIDIASVLVGPPSGVVAVAIALMVVGLLFKVGVVPLHFWAPDVYQGAPTPVTVFMASVVKVAAVSVALRVFWWAFGSDEIYELWRGGIWLAALLTMVVGNLVALRQRSVKRMLAYSSIAHAGYMLMGFLAPGGFGGGAAILYYLVAYTVMTVGAFGVVLVISNSGDVREGADDISRFQQLSHSRPMLAALMSLFLLSLAGLPPGMAGLLGKFYVFNAAVKASYVGIAIVGVLCSVVSCYYYLRIIVAMYFVSPEEEHGEHTQNGKATRPHAIVGEGAVTIAAPEPAVLVTLFVCAVLTVLLGVQPSFLYDAVAGLF
ncbi:MAG: NADH-quinone oxidoreductase subunit N [Bdellovibrionales bacterium]|nr:NADH-quinone oxidoreductase subunit N [Bdellovibrionales bacterium]